mgnify:CR=1 FL=1
MIKITGLYKATSKKNESYLSGKTIDGVKYFVFKNNKTKDNHPDYILYKVDPEESQPKPKPENSEEYLKQVETDDDIPF